MIKITENDNLNKYIFEEDKVGFIYYRICKRCKCRFPTLGRRSKICKNCYGERHKRIIIQYINQKLEAGAVLAKTYIEEE